MLNYTCGLARNAVARELHKNKVNLSDIDRCAITGFIIEQAIISRISFSGLNIAGKGLDKSMSVVLFSGAFSFQTGVTEPTLYCPQRFNYPGINAIIVRIESNPIAKRQKVFMYPLQITLTPGKHSDSHRKFFDDYKSWTAPFEENSDVVPTFLWISPRVASPKKHNPTNEDDWPAHYEEYVPINQVHQKVWEYYVRMNAKLEERKIRSSPSTYMRRGMEKQGLGVSEELEGPGELVRSNRPSAAVACRKLKD